MKKILFISTILPLFFFSFVSAATSSATILFSVHDELGEPLTRNPQVTISGCGVEYIKAPQPIEGKAGNYKIIATFAPLGNQKPCVFEVGARGFISDSARSLGVLLTSSTTDLTSKSFTITYPLVVEVKDELGGNVDNALVQFNENVALAQKNNRYYFAERSTGTLFVEHAGLSDTKIQNVDANSGIQTKVQVVLKYPLKFKIHTGIGEALPNANVTLFTDIARSVHAVQMTGQSGRAAFSVSDGGSMYFALPSGTYYVHATRSDYDDYNEIIKIDKNSQKTYTITMVFGDDGKPSALRSKITVLNQAIADGNTVIQVQIEARGFRDTLLKNETFEVISSRGALDTITYPDKNSTGTGIGIAHITSNSIGPGTFTVKARGNIFSSFPSFYFAAPATNAGSATVSSKKSRMDSTPSPILADGKESVRVSVFAKNDAGALLSGKKVALTSSRPNHDIVTTVSSTTNSEGMAEFDLKSSMAGVAYLYAKIDGVAIHDVISIAVSPITIDSQL